MKAPLSVDDARLHARKAIPKLVFDFIDGASGDEVTLRANRRAFDDVSLVPRAAMDLGVPSLATTVMGQELSMPLLLAPCGGVGLVHPAGQKGVSRAASAAGTLAAVSVLCGNDVMSIPRDVGGSNWLQLFPLGGRSGTERLVEAAREAGYTALVITVDSPIAGRRERDLRNGGLQPGGVSLPNRDLKTIARFAPKVISRPAWVLRYLRAGLPLGHPVVSSLSDADHPVTISQAIGEWLEQPTSWADVEHIRELWDGPIAVKGVLRAQDARRAADAGASCVMVSNHGGRQLDGVPATMDVLEEVVAEIRGDADVVLDSGVRRGVDVVRAVALGAKAVMIGRPYLWGLASGGEAGVRHILELLRAEITSTLTLMGVHGVLDLDRTSTSRRLGSPSLD